MARMPIITAEAIPAKSGVALLARIVGYQRIPITQATLTSIVYHLTDTTLGPPALFANQPLTISSVIYDALQQTDGAWTKDSQTNPGKDLLWGYNFKAILPAVQIANGGDRYHVDVVFTPVTGEQFVVPFEFQTLAVYF